MDETPDFPDAEEGHRLWLAVMHSAFTVGMILSIFFPANMLLLIPTLFIPFLVWMFGRHDTIVRHHGHRLTIFALLYGVVYPIIIVVVAWFFMFQFADAADASNITLILNRFLEINANGEQHPVLAMGGAAVTYHAVTGGFFGTLFAAVGTLGLAGTTFMLIARPIGGAEAAWKGKEAITALPFRFKLE